MKPWKIKYTNRYVKYQLFGLTLFKKKSEIFHILKKFKETKQFNLQYLDREIAVVADKIYEQNTSAFPNLSGSTQRVAFLATELSDTGGHTECVRSLSQLLSEEYELGLFLINKDETVSSAPKKMKDIADNTSLMGLPRPTCKFTEDLIALYNQVVDFNPKVIFLFFHMDDILSAALCHLLQRHSRIKLIYFNHGSHCKALGFSFCDLVIEGMPVTHYVTKHFRGIDKCRVMGLPSVRKENIKHFSQKEKNLVRESLGIQPGNHFTLSGGGGYKFFDARGSEYFTMIKDLLQKESRLQHVVVSEFSSKKMAVIEDIFRDAVEARGRLIFTGFTPNFELLFQACDLFIDSFPVSAALTQIDLMRNKVPTIVKINSENALLSFHEYLPEKYPYMFDNIQDMTAGVLRLLHDKSERRLVVEALYNHFLSHYEGEAVLRAYRELIEKSDNLSQFYQELDPDRVYRLEGVH